MSYSFLLASWGSSGNLNPLLTAGRQLRRRGHRVRVIADPAMRDEVEAAEFAFATWRRAPIGAAADPSDFSDFKQWLRMAIFDPAAAYAADLLDEIGRVPTDAVICLDILFGAALGAEAAGIPFAILSPHVSIRPLPGLPPATSGGGKPKTRDERVEAARASAGLVDLFNLFLPSLNDARSRWRLGNLDSTFALFDRADRVLLAISQAFDLEADSVPDNVRYIGPLLDVPVWSKPWRAPWPAQVDRPRALIACSTGSQGQGELFQRAVSAMGTVDVDAVATTGPNLDVADVRAPKNVHVLQSAPHDAVMRDVSVVISQGGHGTVCRALLHGLPLLILPNQRDQPDNAARIEAHGAGLRLPPTASEAEIAAAVNRLISEPHFQNAARRLGAAIQADVDACCLVQEMEAIVRPVERAGVRRGRRGDAVSTVTDRRLLTSKGSRSMTFSRCRLLPAFTIVEGVRLAHFEAGPRGPAPPLLLVHGWTGDHAYFTPQIAHFSRERRVVAVDLRGHGRSDAPDQRYTIAGFADDIAQQCREISLEKPLVIGHSLGGSIALELCGRHPDLAAGLVMIDTIVMPRPGLRDDAQLGQLVAGIGGSDYLAATRAKSWESGGDFDEPSRRQAIFEAYILGSCLATPRHVAYSTIFEATSNYDPEAAAANCRIPMAYVSADYAVVEAARDLERLTTLCPQMVTAKTLLAGHYNTIEVADQINAMLERFLAVGLGRTSPVEPG